MSAEHFRCHCGAEVQNQETAPVEAPINRCAACGAPLAPDAARCDYCGGTVVRKRTGPSLICPECYARNAQDARYCASCGVEFRPQPVISTQQTLPCPACQGELVARGIDGVSVHECSLCHGLWVAQTAFDSLLDRLVAAYRESPSSGLATGPGNGNRRTLVARKVTYRKCAVCGDLMQRRNFGKHSGIIVDWCGQHGVWLDADELQEVASFIASGGLQGNESVPSGAAGQSHSAQHGTGQVLMEPGRPRQGSPQQVLARQGRQLSPAQMEAMLMAEKLLVRRRPRTLARVLRCLSGLHPLEMKKFLVDLLSGLWGD